MVVRYGSYRNPFVFAHHSWYVLTYEFVAGVIALIIRYFYVAELTRFLAAVPEAIMPRRYCDDVTAKWLGSTKLCQRHYKTGEVISQQVTQARDVCHRRR